jgi:hypothetical protein
MPNAIINPAYIRTSFKDIKLDEHNGLLYLHLDGSIYHVGKEFKNALFKKLHVTDKTTDAIPLCMIMEAAQEKMIDDVIVYVNKGCALAVSIMDSGNEPINTTQAAVIYDKMRIECATSDLEQTELLTEFCIFNGNKLRVFPTKLGVYRIGSLVRIRHDNDSNVKIAPVIEHCSSGKYAVINNRPLGLFVHPNTKELRHALMSIVKAGKPEFYDILASRLRECRNTIASVRECVKVASKMMEILHPERAAKINLPKLFDYYNIAGPNDKNEKWLAIHPSHADRLQLFHLMIDASVNMPREYQEEVGNFLFEVGDLEGSDATRLWGRTDNWRSDEVEDKIQSDDSDICSDMGGDESSEVSEDDSDIASDFGD